MDLPPQVEAVTRLVRTAVDDHVAEADRIVGLHLYGSFLWGGFDDRTSDIDLVAVIDDRAPLMASYEQVRRLGMALVGHGRIDISTTPLTDLGRPVPCRPYILRAAADHGLLVYGRDVLPRGGPLDPAELAAAVDFDLRQLSRNFAGLEDPCWAVIVQKNVRAHFVRLSQLVHSHHPGTAFMGGFEAATAQAVELFASLRCLPIRAAVTTAPRPDVAALMATLVGLRDLLRGDELPAADVVASTRVP
jgi:hypothetical protein